MAIDHAKQRSCTLDLALTEYRGVSTLYDVTRGLEQRLVLRGRVDEPYLEHDGPESKASRFHSKAIRLEISAPPNPDSVVEISSELGVDRVVGAIGIKANVAPEIYDFDGDIVEGEPIKVRVWLDLIGFAAVRDQSREAYEDHKLLRMRLTLIGNELPEPRGRIGLISVRDLDVSQDREYAIGRIELFDTNEVDRLRERVLQVEHTEEEGYGAYVSVLLTDARYDVDIERNSIHSISCDGRIVNCRGKPYDKADVTVEFSEHKACEYERLPRTALFGEFAYFPKQSDEDIPRHFFLRLLYLPDDVRTLLVPLLSQDSQTEVILTANLICAEEVLFAAKDHVQGNIRNYRFWVRRRLITTDVHSN